MSTLECPKVHVIACDLDDSLVAVRSRTEQERQASDAALRKVGGLVANLRVQSDNRVYFGSATGRNFDSIQELAAERPAFDEVCRTMDFHIASVGTAIYTRLTSNFRRISSWPEVRSWNRDTLMELFSTNPDLTLQEAAAQDTYKLSYTTKSPLTNPRHAAGLNSRLLDLPDLQADVIVSGSGGWRFVDILPSGVNKGSALLELPRLLDEHPQENIIEPEICRVACGDSMNDQALLAAADVSIIPGNGQPDLLEWVDSQSSGTFYVSDEYFAAGILQGLERHLYGN